MKTKNFLHIWIIRLLLLLCCLEGSQALHSLFLIPSEAEHALVLGLSLGRFTLFLLCLLLMLLFLFLFCLVVVPQLSTLRRHIVKTVNKPLASVSLLCLCWAVFLAVLAVFLFTLTSAHTMNSLIDSLVQRVGGVLIWLFLCSLQCYFILSLSTNHLKQDRDVFTAALLFAIFALVYFVFTAWSDFVNWNLRFDDLPWVVILPVFCALLGAAIRGLPAARKASAVFRCLFIGTLAFAIYRSSGEWVGRWNSPAKAYWDQLASAFLNGRLYLLDPSTTHDLTFFNGQWYVPNPPLPAILLMPLVWLCKNPDGLNMTLISAIIAALNVMLVYLFLQKCAQRGMTRCSLSANLWITAVFALGTNHWWLATLGQMWFVSQLLTITFLTAACLSAVCGRSGWLSGSLLGLTLLARPNIFPSALFLAGIWLWRETSDFRIFSGIRWKKFLRWGITAAIPTLICAGLLLGYNKLRFDAWLDFGYVNIHGADWILDAVQRYGMFNVHFIPQNFRVMFLQFPQLDFSGSRFFFQPGIGGFCLLAMTPPLIFLVRAFQKDWADLGAWLSVLLTLALLLCYHNTGAEQVGYRYLMDCVPVLLFLLARGVGKRANVFFRLLSFLAFAVNGLSIYWWYLVRV